MLVSDADALGTLRPRLQDQSFLYRQQAALLTRQFAMANRAGWIAIKRALDGPDEFVTPLIAQMEERVHELESRAGMGWCPAPHSYDRDVQRYRTAVTPAASDSRWYLKTPKLSIGQLAAREARRECTSEPRNGRIETMRV